MQKQDVMGDATGSKKVMRPAIVFDDIDEFGDYSTSEDAEPKSFVDPHDPLKKGPIVDERVVKMRIVQALSTRVRAKIT